MARMGQRYDADGRGSEVVAVAESECGLRLGALAYAVFSLRGLDPDSLVWPADRSTEEPLFVGDNGKRMASSSGGRSASMLNRTRAILLRMQLEGQEPELLDLAVAKISSYCWKISGTTAMISQGKDKALITGTSLRSLPAPCFNGSGITISCPICSTVSPFVLSGSA